MDENPKGPADEVQRIDPGVGGLPTLVVPPEALKLVGASWQTLYPWPQIVDCDGWQGDEFTTLEIEYDEYQRRLGLCTTRPNPEVEEGRAAVLAERVRRKLARADRRRHVADAVTAIRTSPRPKDGLGWHETSAELARWRDSLLLEGNVRAYRAVRELLQLRRVLASAGMAYGVVRWLAGHGEIHPHRDFHQETTREVESRKRALRALAVAADLHDGLRPLVLAVEAERERLVGERTKKQRKAAREQRTRDRRAFALLAELVGHDVDSAPEQEKFDQAMKRAAAFVAEHGPKGVEDALLPAADEDDDGIPF